MVREKIIAIEFLIVNLLENTIDSDVKHLRLLYNIFIESYNYVKSDREFVDQMELCDDEFIFEVNELIDAYETTLYDANSRPKNTSQLADLILFVKEILNHMSKPEIKTMHDKQLQFKYRK